MQGAFTDFAIGAGGGLVYALSTAFFGTGLIGALAAPVLAGSVVKGNRGTALATIAGFLLLRGVGRAGGGAKRLYEGSKYAVDRGRRTIKRLKL